MVETAATIYQKERDRFHLLLNEPIIRGWEADPQPEPLKETRLLWLEISPYRIVATMQENGAFSYRHLWENGMYGISRYWLRGAAGRSYSQMRLRNYTRSLTLTGQDIPEHLRLEYELWSNKIQLGRYVLNLEIDG